MKFVDSQVAAAVDPCLPAAPATGDAAVAAIRPLMVRAARAAGVFGEDAEDVAQEAQFELLRDTRRGLYRPQDGSFRAWACAIARHRAIDERRRRRREDALLGDRRLHRHSELARTSAANPEDTVRQAAIVRAAIDELRVQSGTSERTLAVFVGLVAGVGTESIVAEFGLSAAHVHRVKHRMLARVRRVALRLDAQWGDGGL